jgi:hypothetical protein
LKQGSLMTIPLAGIDEATLQFLRDRVRDAV